MVSVRTSVPARNATPSAIEAVVRARRTLCANIARTVAVNMSVVSQLLHVVQDGVGGRVVHLVAHAAVGEEEDAVGVAGRIRVMGDHHDGLTELGDRGP